MIIPNPDNLFCNLAHVIGKTLQVPINIDDPKIIRSEKTPEDRARKIIEIATQLLKASQQTPTAVPALEQCIQHVCSYAFNSWILDSTKKKITEEIQKQLTPLTQNPKTTCDTTPSETSITTEPHIILEPQTRRRSASAPSILNAREEESRLTETSTATQLVTKKTNAKHKKSSNKKHWKTRNPKLFKNILGPMFIGSYANFNLFLIAQKKKN